ncbi:MAG TPA: NADP-dependent oxidoreductase [Candidatus Levilactobacillus faecigallinarum]|uniref:NADP-dependent oxidoreductase n=1 Tax=Candidatus Levilactobacillus faecigallinarum TaxID=2838638 RepID=A0A9D1U5K5_9LACO|nr:NADP-dependent oxidoreductase [Candidatus Levilactobacillus faecigallinarum]
MQAVQLRHYQKKFRLEVRDIPVPTPADNEVLVKVAYAAVNPLEMLIGTGSVRLIQDYRLPVTMGNEFSGTVVAVGKHVTGFQPRDAVYARLPLAKIGAFAEYLTIDQAALAPMPTTLDAAHAAAIPLTGLTAYQGLHDVLGAHAGQSLMIPGGSGSFGQLAIPMAKALGMTVAVSGNQRNREQTLKLGADTYFDYREENYWERLAPVDVVIDTLGKSELAHELSVIKPGGQLLSLRMGPNRRFAQRIGAPLWKRGLFAAAGHALNRQAAKVGVDYQFMFVESNGAQLAKVTALVEQQGIVPALDPHVFALKDVNAALDLVATGHPQGKVLIKLND